MKKTLSFLAAVSLGALMTTSFSAANAHSAPGGQGSCQGDVLDEAALGGFLLVLESNGGANQQAIQSAVAAAAPDDPRTVIVDGIVMTMPEMVLQGLIANGTFIVVHGSVTGPNVGQNGLPCWADPTNCQ